MKLRRNIFLIIFIYFLSFYTTIIHALSCLVVEFQSNIADSLTATNLMDILKKSPLIPTTSVCYVKITVEYMSNDVFIQFRHTNLDDLTSGSVVHRFTMAFTGQQKSNNTQIDSEVIHVCTHNDSCSLQFALSHIKWLVKNNYEQLTVDLSHLLRMSDANDDISNENFGAKCYINSGHEKINCTSRVCLGLQFDQYTTYEAKCLNNADTNTLFALSIITTIFPFPSTVDIHSKQTIIYTCKMNACNSKKQFEQINKTIEHYYNTFILFKQLKNYSASISSVGNSTMDNFITNGIRSILLVLGYTDGAQSTTIESIITTKNYTNTSSSNNIIKRQVFSSIIFLLFLLYF